jgi:hypothetical protein
MVIAKRKNFMSENTIDAPCVEELAVITENSICAESA